MTTMTSRADSSLVDLALVTPCLKHSREDDSDSFRKGENGVWLMVWRCMGHACFCWMFWMLAVELVTASWPHLQGLWPPQYCETRLSQHAAGVEEDYNKRHPPYSKRGGQQPLADM